jgi:hypothetical protein
VRGVGRGLEVGGERGRGLEVGRGRGLEVGRERERGAYSRWDVESRWM